MIVRPLVDMGVQALAAPLSVSSTRLRPWPHLIAEPTGSDLVFVKVWLLFVAFVRAAPTLHKLPLPSGRA